MAKLELLKRIDALATLLRNDNLTEVLSAECESELRTALDKLSEKYIETYCP